ncbi:hypothetical protein [Devosia sp. Root635]|uniref:hypothetical protein n=1 Tax=Devosia sp. Root635 TaxID=1736575 RepID=UPI0006F3774B|nr:hypothetical protein [Devosia sp. Root635]KRA50204.1 hypothetical protein ASD80_16755 [Devosia sp. Root635]
MADLATLRTAELLQLHAEIAGELRGRQILRSANNPTGDYAEHLFAKAMDWALVSNSNAAFDAIDALGQRYQIKCRRTTRTSSRSRQLGALRRLPEKGFDYLAVLLLKENYEVERAMIMPHAVIEPITRFSPHVNGWILRLQEDHWAIDGVLDVTERLRVVAQELL